MISSGADYLAIRLIPQKSSWGPLVIDESSFRKVLTRFGVFPPFVDIARTFGRKTGFEDDSAGGFHFRNDRKTSVFGIIMIY